MVTFVKLTEQEEEARRAKLLEGYSVNQSWINPDGTKVSVKFHTLRSNTVFTVYGASTLGTIPKRRKWGNFDAFSISYPHWLAHS